MTIYCPDIRFTKSIIDISNNVLIIPSIIVFNKVITELDWIISSLEAVVSTLTPVLYLSWTRSWQISHLVSYFKLCHNSIHWLNKSCVSRVMIKV